MKRTVLFLAVTAGLTLSACTDQPVPEPSPTETVTATAEPTPAQPLPSEQHVVDSLVELLPQLQPADVLTGPDAVMGFTQQVIVEPQAAEREPQENDNTEPKDRQAPPPAVCSATLTPQPSVAAHAVNDRNEEQTTVVTAMGFTDPQTAEDFATHLVDVVTQCGRTEEDIIALTHHTDAAFEIRSATSHGAADAEATQTSVVVVRNEQWVLAAASTPASDVALALTLVDQLDEMLR